MRLISWVCCQFLPTLNPLNYGEGLRVSDGVKTYRSLLCRSWCLGSLERGPRQQEWYHHYQNGDPQALSLLPLLKLLEFTQLLSQEIRLL